MTLSKKELICYSTDASRIIGDAEKVFFPKNAKEVQEIIKNSASDIVPRGAGSGLAGGSVPQGSTIIDMIKMNRVLDFNPAKRTLTVEAGVILKELNEKLIPRGFEFPINPTNQGISTIGGMVATNASGTRAMKYGTMRDWVEEIEFVNGRAEIVKTNKADLMDVCGMEGITGVIVSVKLKVIPFIKRSASIFQTDNLEEALSVARRLKSEKEVTAIYLFSKESSNFIGFPEKYNLFVEFDSNRGKITGEEYAVLFKKINKSYYSLAKEGYYNIEDFKFFFDKLKEFFSVLESSNIPYIAYPGNGIVNVFFKDDEKNKRDEILFLMKKTQTKLGSHGVGLRRKEFLDSFEIKLIQRVKKRHDPLGKINRGKLIDETIHLKSRILEKPSHALKEIKPLLGEEKSAKDFLKELDKTETEEIKTPEEKLNSFIKNVAEKEGEIKLETSKEIALMPKSEPKLEKPAEQIQPGQPNNLQIAPKPKLAFDYSQIRNIMTNKYSNTEQKNSGNKPEIKVEDNADKKNQAKPRISDEEKDMINSIMANKFGKGFGKNLDKKETGNGN